jgi:hypothetical protein
MNVLPSVAVSAGPRSNFFDYRAQQFVAVLSMVCACLGFGCFHRHVPPDEAASLKAPRTTIGLQPYEGTLRTTEVSIGGLSKPFAFDTGGGVTIVTPTVAQEIECQPYGLITGFRMNGEKVELERCGPKEITIAGWSVTVEVAVFDLMSLLPSGWPELGGLVSLHTFEGEVVTLELAENRLMVESKESTAARVVTMHRISSRFARQAGGESLDLFVEAKARQGSIWLVPVPGQTKMTKVTCDSTHLV